MHVRFVQGFVAVTSRVRQANVTCERRVWLSAHNPNCNTSLTPDLDFVWICDGNCRKHLEPHMSSPDDYTCDVMVTRKINVHAFVDNTCAKSTENFTDTVDECQASGLIGWRKYNCTAVS